MKTSTPCILLSFIALASVVFSNQAHGTCPETCDDDANTGVGFSALRSLDPFANSGLYNTAVGNLALSSDVSGDQHTAVGGRAALEVTGSDNTAIGYYSLGNNKSGVENTAMGSFALHGSFDANGATSTGSYNTATGAYAMFSDSTGGSNTADGGRALYFNDTGYLNVAVGAQAMYQNRDGHDNTAAGVEALHENTSGVGNTALGRAALFNNGQGGSNTATGLQSLYSNTNGYYNVADGSGALYNNVTGGSNTAVGTNALERNTSSNFNAAFGTNALYYNTGPQNTAIGENALLQNIGGGNNVAVGFQAGQNLTTGSNNIVIGAGLLGKARDANKITIGKQGTQTATYIAGIYGKTVASGTRVGVMIDSAGKLGTVVSSARFKDAIKPMNRASEAILALKPVTFRYKEELDPDKIPQFGLIAEEVEKVDPDLIVRDEDGKVMTVRYEAVNAMLLNEFLKEHRKVEEQGARLAKQEELIREQQTQIKALTATVQKVSEKLEVNKPAPELAANSR